MSKSELTREQIRHIGATKRRAWAQEGAAQEYQHSVYSAEPITRLKNITEIGFVIRHIAGRRVLDAGAGTGRFSIPLGQRGFEVFPLDISAQMLCEGLESAHKTGQVFPATLGDIEHLPFPAETFDSVVSITVLRHFPHWQPLVREYVRVLRPGGRLIFDMGSGDQYAYLENKRPKEDAPKAVEPLDYDGAATTRELRNFARSNGVTLRGVVAHDFLNGNRMLEHVWGESYEDRFRQLLELLEPKGAVLLYEAMARRFLAVLGPALCPSWLAVIDKTSETEPAWEAPCRRALQAASQRDLPAALEACLGDAHNEAMDEVDMLLRDSDARKLMDFLEKELLPHIPWDALCWEAR